jgi:hypothetical protein
MYDIHPHVKEDISRRFDLNIARVRGLITSYEGALPGVQGRPTVTTTDILRGAVVFLHASLEDLLRSILEWKLPSTTKTEHLTEVPLDGEKLRKYTLSDVAKHRGKSVDELIESSVRTSLERSNFNDVEEVAIVLQKAGIANTTLDTHGADLASMMKRRHWIVHRADRNSGQGQGQFAAQSLRPDTVKAWVASVETFGKAVLALL